jgi:hypothetical protein
MKRRVFLQAASVGSTLTLFGLQSRAQASGTTFLVAHGAWSAGWAWRKMHSLMSAAGHRLLTPTYTGLGERAHLANPSIDLTTHIEDVLGVIQYEDLQDFVLVGGWQVPPNPVPPDTSPEDKQWLERLRTPQPIKCFETPLGLRNGDTKLPRSYIYCKRAAAGDVFRQFAARAQQEKWDYHEMDASHAPYVTAPQALATLFDRIAKH